MGTRSLVRFVDEHGSQLVCLFRHYDGYPAGRGTILRDFLTQTKFRDFDTWPVRFVAYELAQHIEASKGKDDGLMLRLLPTSTKLANTDCEYEYVVKAVRIGTKGDVTVCVNTTNWRGGFAGSVAEFALFIDIAEQAMKDRQAAALADIK